jgi:hypothetical protein
LKGLRIKKTNDYGTFYEPLITKSFIMKYRIFTIVCVIVSIVFFDSSAFSQDTSQNQKLSKEEHTYPIKSNKYKGSAKHPIYRDTRLGGSSPGHRTYKTNDYGAGAITTDPHKATGVAKYPDVYFDSSKLTGKIYRDTRLGGSSPGHKTYKSNDYGAGAITTNPKNGARRSGSTPVIVYPTPDSTGK